MNITDYYKYLEHIGIELTNYMFWAPEVFISALYNPVTPTENIFFVTVRQKMENIYGKEHFEKYFAGLISLVRNYNAFKNRYNGTIKDNWLISENFKLISKECGELLSLEFVQLENWQIELRDWFLNIPRN